jgi:hypothetical protein
VSTRNGPKLEIEELVEIADYFLLFDIKSLETCQYVYERVATGRLNADDPDAAPQAVTALRKIASISEELKEIQSGYLYFHRDVLKNRFLISNSGKALSLLSQLIDFSGTEPESRQGYIRLILQMLSTVTSVPDNLVRAAVRGVLDTETRAAVRRRWLRIRETCEWLEQQNSLEPDKVVPAW